MGEETFVLKKRKMQQNPIYPTKSKISSSPCLNKKRGYSSDGRARKKEICKNLLQQFSKDLISPLSLVRFQLSPIKAVTAILFRLICHIKPDICRFVGEEERELQNSLTVNNFSV